MRFQEDFYGVLSFGLKIAGNLAFSVSVAEGCDSKRILIEFYRLFPRQKNINFFLFPLQRVATCRWKCTPFGVMSHFRYSPDIFLQELFSFFRIAVDAMSVPKCVAVSVM